MVIGSGMDEDMNNQYIEAMIQAQKTHRKPFLMVAIPGMPPDTGRSFCQAGVPFFDTAEKALKAYAQVVRYYSGAETARFHGITISAVNRLAASDELQDLEEYL